MNKIHIFSSTDNSMQLLSLFDQFTGDVMKVDRVKELPILIAVNKSELDGSMSANEVLYIARLYHVY